MKESFYNSKISYNFKVGLSPSKKIYVIYFIESPWNMTKNVFCSILKALFVLKIFKFCHAFLVYRKNASIKKIRLISKFITSQPG